MKISNRLKCIANYVPKNTKVVDIGSDHALLPAYLITERITDKVIASDINNKPILRAKKNFPNIEMRVGDGLNTVSEKEIETLVLSGMGGETIVKILDNNKVNFAKTIVVSPNKDSYLVRKKLMKKEFKIIKEELILDKGHIYEIIVFKKGKIKYSNKQLWLGPLILAEKSDMFYIKYKEKLNKMEGYYKKMPFSIKKIITKIKINILKREV